MEKTAFTAAEKQFLSNRKKQAKEIVYSFLTAYPEGVNALNAHFVLAEIYFEESDMITALEHYQKLIDEKPNEYFEQALVRATQILVQQDQQASAVPYWKELENVAVFPENNKRYALFNLMRWHYRSKAYESAQQKAEEVIELENLEVRVKWDAYEILAQSAMELGDTIKAEKPL